MAIKLEVLDELLKDYQNPEDLLGEGGILKELTKRLIERAMEAEMNVHLGYERNGKADDSQKNRRNGHSKKTLKGDFGEVEIHVPRDRSSDFSPKIVPKHETRFDGFDEKSFPCMHGV